MAQAVTRLKLKRVFLGREVAIAFAVVVGLYLVRFVGVQPLQIPAYLLVVTYDIVEIALPVLTPHYTNGFPLFRYAVALVGAAATRWLSTDDDESMAWIRGAGGVCVLVGIVSLLFGAMVGGPVVSPTDNPTPLAITSGTGIVLLFGGWWLLGRPMPRSRNQD